MPGFLFILGTIVIEGGLVALIMFLLTSGDREARREEEAQHRLAELEAEEERLRKAA
jgi:cbb3-type cytochrome oxidase subunit 3